MTMAAASERIGRLTPQQLASAFEQSVAAGIEAFLRNKPMVDVTIDEIIKAVHTYLPSAEYSSVAAVLSKLYSTKVAVRPKRGVYRYNPEHMPVDVKRDMVKNHIAQNPRVLQSDRGWHPTEQVITGTKKLFQEHGLDAGHLMLFDSIKERMEESQAFGASDVKLMDRVIEILNAAIVIQVPPGGRR